MKSIFGALLSVLVIAGLFPQARIWVSQLFQPTPTFAGISLDADLTGVRALPGVSCETAQDVYRGKSRDIVACEDKTYSSNIFGIDYKGRSVYFIDGELSVIKVISRDGQVDARTFPELQQKLDGAYPRAPSPKDASEGDVFWQYGKGSVLVSGPPAKMLMNPRNLGEVTFSLGLIVHTAHMVGIRNQ